MLKYIELNGNFLIYIQIKLSKKLPTFIKTDNSNRVNLDIFGTKL